MLAALMTMGTAPEPDCQACQSLGCLCYDCEADRLHEPPC